MKIQVTVMEGVGRSVAITHRAGTVMVEAGRILENAKVHARATPDGRLREIDKTGQETAGEEE